MQGTYRKEPYLLQEAHDLANDRKSETLPCCGRCGGTIWEDRAVRYNDKFICLECESDLWQEIREDYLERTSV